MGCLPFSQAFFKLIHQFIIRGVQIFAAGRHKDHPGEVNGEPWSWTSWIAEKIKGGWLDNPLHK